MKLIVLMFTILTNYKIVWENVDIFINLGEDTYQYYEYPKASLYVNDVLVDADVYYEKGINHTNLNVINSRHVKTYKIDYRANFDEYAISSTQSIYFNIVDNIAPTFIKVPNLTGPVKGKRLTEKEIIENLIYEDNYYKKEELTIRVNGLLMVDMNIPKTYEIEYEIMDPSLNIRKEIGCYIVENNVAPEIKYKDLIEINYGDNFNYLNHFQFIDNYDKNLTTSINTNSVNFNKIGTYPITVSATNNANLTTTVTANLIIVDKEKPIINFKTNKVLNVFDYNYTYLYDFILSVNDNYDNLTINDVNYLGDIDFNTLGKYEITYKLIDSSNNTFEKKIVFEIADLVSPEVSLTSPLIFNVGSDKPYWNNYFQFSDNYDDFNKLKITFTDKNINFNKLGTQYLEVEVIDNSKNNSKYVFEVEIKDLIAPNVEQMEEIIIKDFSSKNKDFYKTVFAYSDNYTNYNEIEMIINDEFVNYEQIGTYNITFDFVDSSFNKTTLVTNLYILDIYAPIITLTTNKYYYYINDIKPNLNDFILLISDNYLTRDKIALNIVESINYNEVGVYDVIFEVYDEENNYNFEKLLFYVDIKKEQLISGSPLYLKAGEQFVIGSNINFSESVINTSIFPKNIDTSKPGQYSVLYIVYDLRGNYEEYLQTIYIEEKINIIKYQTNIIITVIGIITIIGYYYYSKRNNNTF